MATPEPSNSSVTSWTSNQSNPYDNKIGLTLPQFLQHLKQKGRQGLLDEYSTISSKSPEGSCNVAKLRSNADKNRYGDVLCYDRTRVILSCQNESTCDYINANFVDGYKQKDAFIGTQGPLPNTVKDFWKMIWEQNVLVIVMATRVAEGGRQKCAQYWPLGKGSTLPLGEFKIENLDEDLRPDFGITKLKITNLKINTSREASHLFFTTWPDWGVPLNATSSLQFVQVVREEQAMRVAQLGAYWDGHPLGPPIVVHCSAGIGRTGTLFTIDICIRRLEDQALIDVKGTIEKIRSQRALSIQVPDQYLFCHKALIEYALSKSLLSQSEVDDLPNLFPSDPPKTNT